MSDYNERKLLRRLQALSEIQPDTESTDQAMEKARKAVDHATDPLNPNRPRPSRSIKAKRIVWYTAAAVLVIAALITTAIIWNNLDNDKKTVVKEEQPPRQLPRDEHPDQPRAPVIKDAADDSDEPSQSEIRAHLKRIYAMANDNDIEGLILVLEEGEFAVKLIATSYLLKIGDARAIEPLQKLSDEWYGEKGTNPFAACIEAIKGRIAGPDDADTKEVEQKPDKTLTTTGATVKTPGTVRGIVIDDSGMPVAGAKVIVLAGSMKMIDDPNDQSPSEPVLTAPNGSFTLTNLAPGIVTIKVFHDNYNSVTASDIEVLSGKVTAGVEFVLLSGGIVEGVVYDAGGAPEPDVILYFQDALTYNGPDEIGRLASAVTDEKGFYRVGGLPEQMCYVKRSDEKQRLGVVRHAVMPAVGKTTRLDFGGGPVVSGVILVDGIPLAGTQLVLSDPFSAYPQVFGSYGRTDADGQFAVQAARSGRYGLYYELPATTNRWVNVGAVEMTGGNVDMGVISQATGNVAVFVTTEDPNDTTENMYAYLQQHHDLMLGAYIRPAVQVLNDAPCVFADVPSGKYTVFVRRTGRTVYRRQFELDARSRRDIEVSVSIPVGTSRLSGRYTSDSRQRLVLVDAEQTVVHQISGARTTAYEVSSLPKGNYAICSPELGPAFALMRFAIDDNEHKIIDIDTADWARLGKSALWVQAAAADGLPIIGADIWLTDGGNEIAPTKKKGEGSLFIVEAGRYNIHSAFGGYAEAQMPVDLEENDISAPRAEEKTVFIHLERQ